MLYGIRVHTYVVVGIIRLGHLKQCSFSTCDSYMYLHCTNTCTHTYIAGHNASQMAYCISLQAIRVYYTILCMYMYIRLNLADINSCKCVHVGVHR